MAVLPESMNKLDRSNIEDSLGVMENYIRYMGERIEFAMQNTTRNVAAAGLSSAEMYLLLTTLQNDLSATKSMVNELQGNVTVLQSTATLLQASVTAIDGRVAALESRVSACENTLATLETGLAALTQRVTALETPAESSNE